MHKSEMLSILQNLNYKNKIKIQSPKNKNDTKII